MFGDLMKFIVYYIKKIVESILKLFDKEPTIPELVEWAVCIHQSRAKVFEFADNESVTLGYAFPKEEYAMDSSHVVNHGKEYGWIDLRPWHNVKPYRFIGHDFGYIWLDDPKDRWRIEFRT
jgi:hypothetical protein